MSTEISLPPKCMFFFPYQCNRVLAIDSHIPFISVSLLRMEGQLGLVHMMCKRRENVGRDIKAMKCKLTSTVPEIGKSVEKD